MSDPVQAKEAVCAPSERDCNCDQTVDVLPFQTVKYRTLWVSLLLVIGLAGRAANVAATYLFNGSLAAEETAVPSLLSVDPVHTNAFQSAVVFGRVRSVFYFGGNATPVSEQGGLTLDTTGLIASNNYSVELVFQFYTRLGEWRRIVDVQDRTSDNGFYVDPSNNLDVYPIAGSASNFVNNVFHHVVLTAAPSGTIKAYLDGALQFAITQSSIMDVNNPGNLMHLFLDNTVAGGQGEFSPGQIALFRLYRGVLTDEEVAVLAGNQLPVLSIRPEGANVLLSWSTNVGAFHLESNGDATAKSNWQPVATAPVVMGTNFTVSWVVGGTNAFFRLASP